MGEESEPLTTEAELRRSNRGLVVGMLIFGVLLAIFAGPVFGVRGSIGVIVGLGLAWLNFRWLDSSTRAMMGTPELATTPILAMKYVLRYVLIAAVIFGIWYYDLLPVAAVIAGLASFAIAVVFKGLKSIFTS
jgi:predicted secreted protein